jgi:hypothetical protein
MMEHKKHFGKCLELLKSKRKKSLQFIEPLLRLHGIGSGPDHFVVYQQ